LYDKNSGPEICLDDFLSDLEEVEGQVKSDCFEDYDKDKCKDKDVKVNFYQMDISPQDLLLVRLKSFEGLPQKLLNKIGSKSPEELK
jgi:hypothetical protein